MSDSTEGMAENMKKGRGITEKKEDFKIIGVDSSDRDHPLLQGGFDKRMRGRPAKEQNFRQVGPNVEQENG